MTRTERAAYPRALRRDRSESKSGLDKSLRKGGGGHHNWGSIADEGYLEAAGVADEEAELAAAEPSGRNSLERPSSERSERSPSSPTEEDMRIARHFRKTALKNQEIDLSAIARTSAAVSTSPDTRILVPMV